MTGLEARVESAVSRALADVGWWVPLSVRQRAAQAAVAVVWEWEAADPAVAHVPHEYLSTGCLHGDQMLPDGRTGHEYCRGEKGALGTKAPGQCKFCGAPCRCDCHRNPAVYSGDLTAPLCCCKRGLMCAACGTGSHRRCPDRDDQDDHETSDDEGDEP